VYPVVSSKQRLACYFGHKVVCEVSVDS